MVVDTPAIYTGSNTSKTIFNLYFQFYHEDATEIMATDRIGGRFFLLAIAGAGY